MTAKIQMTESSRSTLVDLMRQEITAAIGRKALEFGSGIFSLAAELRNDLDYLACTDKSSGFEAIFQEIAAEKDLVLIPDHELGEDCYFGRFHVVYTIFGLQELPHLVDEIMRMRRLLLKGGKLVIIDSAANGFDQECRKQLKRCGFVYTNHGIFELDGISVFHITAEK